jgi:hypothetical protein
VWISRKQIKYESDFSFVRFGGGREDDERVYQQFTDFKVDCGTVRREILYNVLIEFGLLQKFGILIMYLSETYNNVSRSKRVSDNFQIQNCLKQGGVLLPLLFNLV